MRILMLLVIVAMCGCGDGIGVSEAYCHGDTCSIIVNCDLTLVECRASAQKTAEAYSRMRCTESTITTDQVCSLAGYCRSFLHILFACTSQA